MKVLMKKLKKVDGLEKFFYFLSLIIYIFAIVLFIYSIFKYKAIITSGPKEMTIVIIIIVFFCIWFLLYLLCGLITMISKKLKAFIFITILTILFSCGLCTVSVLLNKVAKGMDLTANELTYTSALITLKETSFNDSIKIGMIESESDIEGNILAKELIKKEKLSNEIVSYDDYSSMIADLYKGKIGACFVSNNYAVVFSGEDFEDKKNGEAVALADRVKVIHTYSDNMTNQDTAILSTNKEKSLTEPFTVLIMGVDSALNGLKANQAFNGDTLILVTFNPNTLTATMFSIPRDMYVPIACNHNRYAKINSSAAYGSSCVISTVQQLTGIDIDYYAKINFTGVVELVDAVGGIEVDVETPDFSYDYNHVGQVCEQDSKRRSGKNLICIKPGYQKLNGEQALAYARCRHLYAISDIARNQHQQAIIEALANKLKEINSIDEFKKIFNSISNNIETNITSDQIMSFYSVGKDMLANSSSNSLSIKKTYLSYYSLNVYLPGSGMYTSALGYYPESLNAITKLMRVNLELETEEPIKTFSISYNEEYTTPIVGQGLTGGTKLELMKSFIGSSESSAYDWCSSLGLSCSFQTRTDYNPEGIIVDQSVHSGELLKGIGNITFYVSDGEGEPPLNNNDEDDENNDEDDESNSEGNNKNKDKDKDKDNGKDKTNKNDSEEEEPTVPGGPSNNDEDENNTDDNSSGNNDKPEDQEPEIPGTPTP